MASIKKNFFYSSILTTANYFFPLITYPYIARVLGVTNIGICNFVDSIVNYFIILSMLGINTVGIREIARSKNDPTELNKTFNSIFAINMIATFIALIVLIMSIYLVPQLKVHKELMYFGALKLVFNFLLIEWLYKGLEDFRYITNRTLVVKVLYVISCFVFIHKPSDYPLYYLLMVSMVVFNAIFNIVYVRKWVHFSFKNLEFIPFVKPILILGIYMVLTSMYTSFNVAFLGFESGEKEVGYYTTATKIFMIIIALYSAFTGVMLPRMSSLIGEKKMDEFRLLYKKSIDILLYFSIPIVVFSVIFSKEIVRIVAGDGFEQAVIPMQIVMPLIFIIGYEQILIIQTLMPLKKDKQILINSLAGAIMGVCLNFLLVPTFQSLGTALVWMFSEITVLICAQFYVSKSIQLFFPIKKFLLNVFYNAPLALLLLYLHSMQMPFWSKILCGCLLLFIYVLFVQIRVIKDEYVLMGVNKILKKINR